MTATQRAIALVQSINDTGKVFLFSGVFVGKNMILTCAHDLFQCKQILATTFGALEKSKKCIKKHYICSFTEAPKDSAVSKVLEEHIKNKMPSLSTMDMSAVDIDEIVETFKKAAEITKETNRFEFENETIAGPDLCLLEFETEFKDVKPVPIWDPAVPTECFPVWIAGLAEESEAQMKGTQCFGVGNIGFIRQNVTRNGDFLDANFSSVGGGNNFEQNSNVDTGTPYEGIIIGGMSGGPVFGMQDGKIVLCAIVSKDRGWDFKATKEAQSLEFQRTNKSLPPYLEEVLRRLAQEKHTFFNQHQIVTQGIIDKLLTA